MIDSRDKPQRRPGRYMALKNLLLMNLAALRNGGYVGSYNEYRFHFCLQ